MTHLTDRRTLLAAGAAGAAGLAMSPFLSFAQDPPGAGKKILFFTKSQGFAHGVVTRRGEELAFAEQIFETRLKEAGYDVTVSKDGTLFNPDVIDQWDGFALYTTEELTRPVESDRGDMEPPMTEAGKEAFLSAIAAGKGYFGFHCASDTFHVAPPNQRVNEVRAASRPDDVSPYIAMVGGEFKSHGSEQSATIRVASRDFPGLADLEDFEMVEEWYSLVNLAPDMHVILVQDTTSMTAGRGGGRRGRGGRGGRGGQAGQRGPEVQDPREPNYRRDPYPNTWARKQGEGRVFYTSMGHREDVWENEIFQKVMLAGVAWIAGVTEFEPTPNLAKACPELAQSTLLRTS